MTGYEDIPNRLEVIQSRIHAACMRSGRTCDSITLLAVSKFHPAEAVAKAYEAGLRVFGENRVQEAVEKFNSPLIKPLRNTIQVHFQGHLQSNKINKALELFDCIQSLDSLELIEQLIKRLSIRLAPLEVLFELHTGEASKAGFLEESALLKALERVLEVPQIKPRGLMTMAPFTSDTDAIRASFKKCKKLFEHIQKTYKIPDFTVLSMGMSNDFEIAVEEGSTLLRIGTAIFGERTYE